MANDGKETNGKSAEKAKEDVQPAQVQVVGQYVKDLSFENPNITKLLTEPGDNPNIKITVNVSSNGAGADINTSGGGIDLVIPQGIGFDLDADADGAEVEARLSDLRTSGRFSQGRLSGTIGGGGNPLRLRSHDGDIVISDR